MAQLITRRLIIFLRPLALMKARTLALHSLLISHTAELSVAAIVLEATGERKDLLLFVCPLFVRMHIIA